MDDGSRSRFRAAPNAEVERPWFSDGALEKFTFACKEVGLDQRLLNKLSQEKATLLTGVRDALRGTAVIRPNHLVDCDAEPFCPDGLLPAIHNPGWPTGPKGLVDLSKARIGLYYTPKQEEAEAQQGIDVAADLIKAHAPVLNANFLDHYIAYPHLIDPSWKRLRVFFWGTVYREVPYDRDDHEIYYVRYLYWRGKWRHDTTWFLDFWSQRHPAAVLLAA